MNRLQYRHAFAKRYHERTGNYMVGWLLSKAAALSTQKRYRVNMGYAHTTPFTGILDEQLLRDGCKNNLSIGFKAQNSGRPYMVKRPFLAPTRIF